MHDIAAWLGPWVTTLLKAQRLVIAVVLGFFFGVAARQLLFLLWVDRGRNLVVVGLRLVAALLFGGMAMLLAEAVGPGLSWDRSVLLGVAAGAASVLIEVLILGLRQLRPGRPPLLGWLVRLVLVLAALLAAAVVLLRTGYLALAEERPLLLVEVTGETATRSVRWAPPDQPLREETLRTSQVILRTPAGQPVAQAWIYGDQVAISGRVLRLSPLLNVAGLSNLFALDFLHNGYATAERHNHLPHQAVPLMPIGQLAVHPRWRELQERLLARWEQRSPGDSGLMMRAATTESTYFALVEPGPGGKPLKRTYTLVLTPGGLTSR
jgi:hypothetical protein